MFGIAMKMSIRDSLKSLEKPPWFFGFLVFFPSTIRAKLRCFLPSSLTLRSCFSRRFSWMVEKNSVKTTRSQKHFFICSKAFLLFRVSFALLENFCLNFCSPFPFIFSVASIACLHCSSALAHMLRLKWNRNCSTSTLDTKREYVVVNKISRLDLNFSVKKRQDWWV